MHNHNTNPGSSFSCSCFVICGVDPEQLACDYNYKLQTIERGYAGRSVFDWTTLPTLSPRYTDYARLISSVGINAIVWDNVNACKGGNDELLSSASILKLAPLAELFYQVRVGYSFDLIRPIHQLSFLCC